MKNCQGQGKVREKWNCFANVLENVDNAHLIDIFCQRIKVLESEKKQSKKGQGDWKLKNNDFPDD